MFFIFTLSGNGEIKSDFKQKYLYPCSAGPLYVKDLGCYVTVDSVDSTAVGRVSRFLLSATPYSLRRTYQT
jgi:hypothetical protein